MSDQAIEVRIVDLGIVNGLQTWEVIDQDSGETIGWNQSAPLTEEI